jgi:hypothetical protein
MKLQDATPPYTSEEIGTPRDYTEDRYKVYFEVADMSGKVFEIVDAYSSETVVRLPHGYEAILAIQMVPDIVREIAAHNIALYQVVRYAKVAVKKD